MVDRSVVDGTMTLDVDKAWGLLPDAVEALVRSREWDDFKRLQKRLAGDRAFPISVSLKPPTERQALADIARFEDFVARWRQFSRPELVQWETRNYRSLKNQQVPRRLLIADMRALLDYLGEEAVARSLVWEQRMAPLLSVNQDFYPVLIRHLAALENLSAAGVERLVNLLPQMRGQMGAGLYLRALPLVGVDTKFVETQASLIAELLDVMHGGEIAECGGLMAWLGCKANPSGWVTVRPLCPRARARMGGFSILQLPADELRARPLPATNILVVENLQSGLGLPELDDTVAIFGGGRNVSWMDAQWLPDRRVGYWGDIDTWGLVILSEARALAPGLTPIMMDRETLLRFREQMVAEEENYPAPPPNLNNAEKALFVELRDNVHGADRLEQEKLPVDYCRRQLEIWVSGSPPG